MISQLTLLSWNLVFEIIVKGDDLRLMSGDYSLFLEEICRRCDYHSGMSFSLNVRYVPLVARSIRVKRCWIRQFVVKWGQSLHRILVILPELILVIRYLAVCNTTGHHNFSLASIHLIWAIGGGIRLGSIVRLADPTLLVTRALVTPIELVVGKRIRRPTKDWMLVLSTCGVKLLLLIRLLFLGVG